MMQPILTYFATNTYLINNQYSSQNKFYLFWDEYWFISRLTFAAPWSFTVKYYFTYQPTLKCIATNILLFCDHSSTYWLIKFQTGPLSLGYFANNINLFIYKLTFTSHLGLWHICVQFEVRALCKQQAGTRGNIIICFHKL